MYSSHHSSGNFHGIHWFESPIILAQLSADV
jgi:hypothetical protein